MCMPSGGGGPAAAAPVNPFLTQLNTTNDSIARSDYKLAGQAGQMKLLADQAAYDKSIAPTTTRRGLSTVSGDSARPSARGTNYTGEQAGLQIR